MHEEATYLNFHDILVNVISNDKEVITFVESDFSYFIVSPEKLIQSPQITITANLDEPPYCRIPNETIAAYYTKDAIIYKNGDIHYLDSFGKCLVINNHKTNSSEIYSLNRDVLYEKIYLMIMSSVGTMLDKRKFHRIHSMGVAYKGKAILCLLPMGGGKTTLTLALLKNKSFSLLSEEVPLISNKGFLYPFPIRMGVIDGTTLEIPEEYLKKFKRSNYEPKTLIDVRFFSDQIASKAEPGILFIGKRIYSSNPQIIGISKFKAFMPLFRLCVMGLGIPQLMEYILRFDIFDMTRQFPLFISRLKACLLLLKKSETYELLLSYDRDANANFVIDFVEKKIK